MMGKLEFLFVVILQMVPKRLDLKCYHSSIYAYPYGNVNSVVEFFNSGSKLVRFWTKINTHISKELIVFWCIEVT